MSDTRRSPYTITKFTRHDEGDRTHYSARVSLNGSALTFHTRFGSWLTDGPDGTYLEPTYEVKLLLSKRMPVRRPKQQTPNDSQEADVDG